MGLGALTAIGAGFEGYSKDEDAKAKTASDLQLLYLKAEQDRLTKQGDRAFTAEQNRLNRELQTKLKERELEIATGREDVTKAEGQLSAGIQIGEGEDIREIQVPKPSTWKGMSTTKRDTELQRLISYDLTEEERNDVNKQLALLDTDPNRKKLGLAKEVFGENYFTEITEGYLMSRTSGYQDAATGVTVKPSRYSWMGNSKNYKDIYREYLTAIDGRDTTIYNQGRQNGTFVIDDNGDYSWITDQDAANYEGDLDLTSGIQASIGPNLYVNPKRNQPDNFNRFVNSSINEEDKYTRTDVVPALLNSMFKTISPNNLDNVNIIKGVFNANLTSTIDMPTYNPSTDAVELVPTKSGFDSITFRNNIYHANHDSAAETRNNTFTALPEKNYNNGGGKAEESYRAGSDRLAQIEDGRVGLSKYLDIYANLVTAEGFNQFVGADSFIDPQGFTGGIVSFFSNIFGKGGQADQVLAIREANDGLLKTLGTYAEDSVVKAITQANATIFSKTATANELLEALKVMNGYAAALITQGGKSESARISDKDLEAGISMTSGSTFAKPRDRMQLAYNFLGRNAVEYAALQAVDTNQGWNYTNTFQTAKRYFSAYYNAQPTYYENMGDDLNVPTKNPYQYSNFMLLVDDRQAVQARRWENIIYKDEFAEIYTMPGVTITKKVDEKDTTRVVIPKEKTQPEPVAMSIETSDDNLFSRNRFDVTKFNSEERT